MYNFLMNADPALKFYLLVSMYMCTGHVEYQEVPMTDYDLRRI